MNDRQRFLNCMLFREIDRPPRWEWGFRKDTTARWHREGLPADVPGKIGWTDFLNLDRGGGYANGSMAERVGVDFNLMPDFSGRVIEEDDQTVTSVNKWGARAVKTLFKKGSACFPSLWEMRDVVKEIPGHTGKGRFQKNRSYCQRW